MSCSKIDIQTLESTTEAVTASDKSDFVVTILGSGIPIPSQTQVGTAILVEVGSEVLLFDCGRGCSSRLAEYKPEYVTRVDKLFLTHLHGDHIVGVPDIWLNGWTLGRDQALQIWGPPQTQGLADGLLQAFGADIGYRTPNLDQPIPTGRKIVVHSVPETEGIVYEQSGIVVTAFRVDHAHVPAYGYRIDYGSRSVLISGDTTATPNLEKYGAGADVILLEVLSPSMVDYVQRSFAPMQVQAIMNFHLTTRQAAQVFSSTSPQLGVYYHTVVGCETDKALLAETGDTYTGAVQVARDLMQIHLNADGVETNYLKLDPANCGL